MTKAVLYRDMGSGFSWQGEQMHRGEQNLFAPLFTPISFPQILEITLGGGGNWGVVEIANDYHLSLLTKFFLTWHRGSMRYFHG